MPGSRYALQRIPDGAFVARPGSASSYTRQVLDARVFRTEAEAEANRCIENERIVDLDVYIDTRLR